MKYWCFSLSKGFYITPANSVDDAKQTAEKFFGTDVSLGEPRELTQDQIGQYIGQTTGSTSTVS